MVRRSRSTTPSTASSPRHPTPRKATRAAAAAAARTSKRSHNWTRLSASLDTIDDDEYHDDDLDPDFSSDYASAPPSRGTTTPKFVEPELAKPTPIYTGQPLEEPPSARIRRESLWRKRKGEEPQEPANDDTKHHYDAQLQPSPPPQPSHTRAPLVALPPKTPATPPKRRHSRQPSTPSQARPVAKRIKVSSPKKQHISNLAGVAHGVKIRSDADSIKDNDDFCSTCGLPGIFICCESCPKSFHFTCADPPLAEIPDDDWHCRECTARAVPDSVNDYRGVGLFGPLLSALETRNPVVFALPRAIRDDTFIGVQTGDFGDYSDDSIKPELTSAKLNGAQIKGCNRDESLEVDKLYDIAGNPYLCHKCGGSGLNHRTLAHCDYCPLVWHLDCLEYPMCSPKTMGSKWRCPAHLEDLLPRNFANSRMLRQAKVTDVALYNHFVRMANQSSAVLFQYPDAPFIRQGYYPTLDDYINVENEQRQAEEEAKKVRANLPNGSTPRTEFKRPDWLANSFSQRNMIMAPISRRSNLGKLTQDRNGVIYRVPESSVMLDFITKVKKERVEHPMRHGVRVEERVSERVKEQVMGTLDQYASAGAREQRIEELANDDDAHEATEALAAFHHHPWSKQALDELVEVAKRHATTEVTAPVVTTDEVTELIKIKKLLQLKGKDKVLQFLEQA